MLFPKSHEKSTFSFKSCENRYPQSISQSRLRSQNGNFLKVGARAGVETNSFGSTTLELTENSNFRLFAANGKWKFVFLCWQKINGNQHLLFQQMCPSMPK
jgi:hypothetical protein